MQHTIDTPFMLTSIARTDILTLLPQNGIVAEIGVRGGAFSRQILRRAYPKTLHLIDPWAGDDQPNAQRLTDAMVAAYQGVQTGFAHEIGTGRVVLHRAYSTVAAPDFPDAMFDWIHLDARHDYDNVLADLRAFKDTIKPDGFIFGNHFSAYRSPERFGVVPAVREFAATEGFQVLLITNETNPSYLLARVDNDTTAQELRAVLVEVDDAALAFDASLLGGFTQGVAKRDGRAVRIPRFGPSQ